MSFAIITYSVIVPTAHPKSYDSPFLCGTRRLMIGLKKRQPGLDSHLSNLCYIHTGILVGPFHVACLSPLSTSKKPLERYNNKNNTLYHSANTRYHSATTTKHAVSLSNNNNNNKTHHTATTTAPLPVQHSGPQKPLHHTTLYHYHIIIVAIITILLL